MLSAQQNDATLQLSGMMQMPTNIRSKSVSEIGNLKLQIPITLLIVAVAAAVLVLTQTTATNPTPAIAQSGQTSTLGEPLVGATRCGTTNGLAGRIQKVASAIVVSVQKDIAATNIAATPPVPTSTAVPDITDCSQVTAAQMADITTLDLRRLELRELRASDLAGLTSLQELYVMHNSLTSLNANTFSSLTTLTDLDLGNNELGSVHQNLFAGLTNLRRVALDNNGLSSLHEDIFDGLTSLRVIELQRNELTTLDADIFDGLSSLRRLYLENNSLTTLPSNIFSGLSLTRLNLDNNGLTSLPTISNFGSYLTNLDLAGNALTALPDLSNHSNLDALDISRNTGLGTNLTATSFSGTALTELDMSDIGLTSLPANIFSPLTDLWELKIRDNSGLTTLPANIFTSNSGIILSLTNLHLNNNGFTSLPELVFDNLETLDTLDLSGNQLATLPNNIFNYIPDDSSVQTGDPDDQDAESYLDYLDLSGNQLTNLHADIFDELDWLTLLDLSDNSLGGGATGTGSLPSNIFDGTTSLTWLGLSDNRTLQSWPTLNTSLVSLFATNTSINDLPSNLSSMTSLKTLHLYHSSLTPTNVEAVDFPSGFSNLEELLLGLTEPTTQQRTPYTNRLTGLVTLKVQGPCGNSAMEGRTQAVIDAITADVGTRKPGALNNCGGVFWNDLITNPSTMVAGVTSLDLSGQSISTLKGEHGSEYLVGDFEGLTELTSLNLSNNNLTRLTRDVDSGLNDAQGNDIFTDASAGIFVSLGALEELNLCDNRITSWDEGATGVFSGLRDLETLRLCDNQITTLNDVMFDSVPDLQNLYLDGNMLEDIYRPGVFAALPDLQTLDLSDVGVSVLHPQAFSGLPNLRTLHLKDNAIGNLDPQVLAPLTSLRTLSINHGGSTEQDRATEQALRAIRPALQVTFHGTPPPADATQRPGEPTWTPTAIPTDTPIPAGRILRIKPSVESISIRAGSKVRLSVSVFGLQNEQDDSLAEKEEVTFEWSSSNGEGSFEESAPAGAETNGEPDDRKVLHTVSDIPGTYTVTATLGQGECRGTDEQCSATVRITVIRTIVREASATPVPCQISGTIPAAIPDSAGNQHSVFTPTDGGTFTGENVEVTAPINAVAGCEYIGIRVVESGPAMNRNNPLYRYTLAGMLYSVQAVDSSGATITDYQFNRPIQVCVPLPGTLRGNISEIDALKLNSDGTLTALTSKILSTPNGSPRVCGNLSELPADIAAGKRGAPDPTPEPMPTATPEPPETGGTAVPYTWAWLIAILGVGVFVLGAATLTRRRETTTATVTATTTDNDNTMFLNRKS